MKVSGVFRHAKSFRDVPAGGVIFEQGASGAEMFGVMAGEVELRFPTCAGMCRPVPADGSNPAGRCRRWRRASAISGIMRIFISKAAMHKIRFLPTVRPRAGNRNLRRPLA